MRLTILLLTVVLLTTGCLSTPIDGTVTPVSAPDTTPSRTTQPGSHEHAMNEPDPNKTVLLENDWNRTVEMHVTVIREATNETVHEGRYDVEPGSSREVYHTAAAEPDGIERFTVILRAGNETNTATIETNLCYGPAYATIQEDGTPYLYYAFC
jgi:hypothetical protein